MKIKLKKNQGMCACCGQPRPYPTEPGIWEYTECPAFINAQWERVEVKYSKLINPNTGKHWLELVTMDGVPLYWPVPAAWRKVKKNVKRNKRKS